MLRTRKVLSALAAAAVLSTSAFAGVGATIYNAPVASAQVETPVQEPAATVGIPSTGNLNIHKIIGPETEVRATGEEMTVEGTRAVGIDFNVYRVNSADGQPIDLTTSAGWQAAAGLNVNDFFTGADEGAVKSEANLDEARLTPALNDAGEPAGTAETNTDGIASFTDLPAGVYLVLEQANQFYEGQALAPSEPFLVSVPMTNTAGTDWLDTVNVYPKNQVVEGAMKTVGEDPAVEGVVNQPGSAVGEYINYDISATIPTTGANGLNAFTFTDKLPQELGEPTNITVTIGGTRLESGEYNVAKWNLGADTSDDLADDQWVLHVKLTGPGLTTARANAGQTIELSFDAQVLRLPSGSLNNNAWTTVTDPNLAVGADPASHFGEFVPNTNQARSIYGEILIQKTGANGEGLPDAVFELHRCSVSDTGAATIEGAPLRVGGQTTFTTGADGTALISGIHLADVRGTEAESVADVWIDGYQFCLEETVAPSNHSLLPAPVLLENPFAYTETTDTVLRVTQPVANVDRNLGFTLPMTGGKGFWLIVGAGVVLLVVAGGYYVIARNRSENTN